MKIKRSGLDELNKDTQIPEDVEPITCEDGSTNGYGKACDYILSAIKELSDFRNDSIASESLANLSVVLFDLQNGGN